MALTGAEVANLAFVVIGAGLGIYTAVHEEHKGKEKVDDYDWSDVVERAFYKKWKRTTWLTVVSLVAVVLSTFVVTWLSSIERAEEKEAQEMADATEDSLTQAIVAMETARAEELAERVDVLNDTLENVSNEERARFRDNLQRQQDLLLGLDRTGRVLQRVSANIEREQEAVDNASIFFILWYSEGLCKPNLMEWMDDGLGRYTEWIESTNSMFIMDSSVTSIWKSHREIYDMYFKHHAQISVYDSRSGGIRWYYEPLGLPHGIFVTPMDGVWKVQLVYDTELLKGCAANGQQPLMKDLYGAKVQFDIDHEAVLADPTICPFDSVGEVMLCFKNGDCMAAPNDNRQVVSQKTFLWHYPKDGGKTVLYYGGPYRPRQKRSY